MKKKVKRLASVLMTAVIASSAFSASSSALSFCIGGKCFNIGLPSGSCNMLPQLIGGQYTLIDCIRNGNCGNTAQNTCTNGRNCGSTQNSGSCEDGQCTEEATKPKPAETVSGVSADVNSVFELVNSERAKNGLSALMFSSELSAAAEIRAKEIVRSFSHTRPNGSSCFTVLAENGITYRTAGENLAYGQRTASAVMNGWMNSSGHRANILGKNFGKIGIACYTQNGVKYWVQIFTN